MAAREKLTDLVVHRSFVEPANHGCLAECKSELWASELKVAIAQANGANVTKLGRKI